MDALNLLNGYDAKIKFTAEMEENGQLPFLDAIMIKKGQQIITDVYTKPTKSNRMIDFNSYHPMNQKMSIIYGELTRINRISHETFRKRNLNNFTLKCEENGYPRELVDTLSRRYFVNQFKKRKKPDNCLRFVGSMTYIPRLTDLLVEMFKRKGVLLAKRPVKPLLTLYKSPKIKCFQSECNVVYRVNCMNCDKFYIGETGRLLKTRLIEHDKSVINQKLVSALAIHSIDLDHNFNFNEVSIVCRESDIFIRKMKESLHILKNRSCVVNFKVDTENNVKYYSNLIDKLIR